MNKEASSGDQQVKKITSCLTFDLKALVIWRPHTGEHKRKWKSCTGGQCLLYHRYHQVAPPNHKEEVGAL